MSRPIVVLCVVVLLPALVFPGSGQLPTEGELSVPDRVFALVMNGEAFNGQTAPDAPLLEAYLGETMRFVVYVPPTAEPHTFHVHGHPWVDPETGDFIDAVRIDAGDYHTFEVEAGFGDPALAGDWFYHCHVEMHFVQGMWGIMRIYPYAVEAVGAATALSVTLDQLGNAVHGATFEATWNGAPVSVAATNSAEGTYLVRPEIPAAAGRLVLTSNHDLGQSVARFDVAPDGTWTAVRDVSPERAPVAANPVAGMAPTIVAKL